MHPSPERILHTGLAFGASTVLLSTVGLEHLTDPVDTRAPSSVCKAYAALPPGGAVIIHDAIMETTEG